MFADLVNRADVRVVQGGGGAGFAQETLQGLAVGQVLLGEEFQGYVTIQRSILGLLDHTHPTGTQLLNNAVSGYGLSYHGSNQERIGLP